MNQARIRELRERREIAQKALAIDLGVSQATVSNWESGHKVPSARSTRRLADYFGVSMDYLMGYDDTEPVQTSEEQKKTRPPKKEDGPENERVRAIIQIAEQLDPDRQAMLLRIALAVANKDNPHTQ